jgi:hypothetical protein
MKRSVLLSSAWTCAILVAGSGSLHATTVVGGASNNVADQQFIHPTPESFAVIDLLAGHPYMPGLLMQKITASGKVLFTLTSGYQIAGPTSQPVGYIWDKGVWSAISTPPLPWIYSTWPSVFAGFSVTDMNDAGVVVGTCDAACVPLTWNEFHRERICIVWPADQLANPRELNPGLTPPDARLNFPYRDGGPYTPNFRNTRIDDAGNCYGLGSVSLNWGTYLGYQDDVVKWSSPDASPENLTGNVAVYLTEERDSYLLDVGPAGNVLLRTRKYHPTTDKYEGILADPPLRFDINLMNGEWPRLITDTGAVVFGTHTRTSLYDASGTITPLLNAYGTPSSSGDILTWQLGYLIQLSRRQTSTGKMGYFPFRVLSTQEVYGGYTISPSTPTKVSTNGLIGAIVERSVNLQGAPLSSLEAQRPFLYMPAALKVDSNHDGAINDSDMPANPPEYPLRVGINNNDDNPGTTTEADYINNVVDGPDDLADFTPVYLDIKRLMNILPPSATVRYKLKQADGKLNFVYTSLTQATAFDYQNTSATTGYGPNHAKAAAEAPTHQITATGIDLFALAPDLADRIKNQDQGVILVELRGMTDAPLKLVVENNGVACAEVAVNISTGEVKFEAIAGNAAISDNKNGGTGAWMPGKGVRIFPDSINNTDITSRNRLYVKVGLAGATGNVTLKIIDVDDPSPSATALDPDYNHLVDPNDISGEQGNDNTGDVGGGRSAVFVNNDSTELTCTLGSDGIARINGQLPQLKVSMCPGDNYRVAVAQTPSDLGVLQVTNPSGGGYVKPSDGQSRSFTKGLISEMLTVWRKLHVEQDTMKLIDIIGPEKNYEVASIDSISPAAGAKFVINVDRNLPGGDDRFKGGQLSIEGDAFEVISNENNLFTGADITVADNASGAMASRYASGQLGLITLIDDDRRNGLPEAELPVDITDDFIDSYVIGQYASAYIEPDSSQPNPYRQINFLLNTSPPYPNSVSRNLVDRPDFWSVRIVAAFQCVEKEDGDPDTGQGESLTTGEYSGGDVFIFMEGIREQVRGFMSTPPSQIGRSLYLFNRRANVAHEMAHAPNPSGDNDGNDDHAEGSLMSNPEVAEFKPGQVFTSKTISRLRKAIKWCD